MINKSIFFYSLLFLSVFFSCQNVDNTNVQQKKHLPEKPIIAPDNARFELLVAETTGINFSNNISEDKRINIVSNSYMYNGGGVAILDVNNDGLQDVFFTSSQESNRLYLNKGNFKFEDITNQAKVSGLGGFTTGVTVVDINNDGLSDLYVCRSGLKISDERRNLLFINNGDLSFSEKAKEYGLDDVSASNHANFFDYDLDGDLDLYVINHPITFTEVNKVSVSQEGEKYIRNTEPRDEYESDKLFRNNGNGTFSNVSKEAGINNRAWSLSVTVSDFNEDGYPDIFVGNDYIEPDWLYINNKKGGFEIKTDEYFRHLSNHTLGVDIADYNNDGKVDLVALDMIAEGNQRQKELMTTMVLERYNSLVRYGYGHQIMRNALQLNNGNGTFSEIGTLAGISNTDWSWACLFADFDNDTQKDLFITNGYRRDLTNLDYLTYTVDSINRSGGLAQFKNFDDYLKKIPSTRLQNYMFKNSKNLAFKKVSTDWGFVQKSYSNGTAYGDLDNDGDLDLVVNNIEDPAFLYRNNTQELYKSNYLQIKLIGDAKNKFAVGSSVKIYHGTEIQYQELMPVRGFFSSVEHILHFGLGKHSEIDKIEVIWHDGNIQTLENVTINQKLILRHEDSKKGNLLIPKTIATIFQKADVKGLDFYHKENEFLDFDRERLLPHQLSKLGPSITVGDVNGDGIDDLYIGGAVNQPGVLYIQNSNSTFSEAWQSEAKFEDLGCTFFDADQDGDLDLYVVSGGNIYSVNSDNYQDRLYLNDGKGNLSFQSNALPRITTSGSCVTPFDFDKDGDLDLFVGGRVTPNQYPTIPQSYILQNTNGNFVDVTNQVAPEFQHIGMISDIKWANLDSDPSEEMILVGEWMPVTIFKLKNGKLENATLQFGLNNTNGWWNCIEIADMDNDGDLDLIGGNLGFNSRLKATEKEPLTLFAADFDKNSSIDPILARYENGALYPIPQRDAIIKQLPFLKKKFVRFKDYANAPIQDVFSQKELDNAQKLEAKVLATSYFENNGNGQFIIQNLSNEAQFSPCYAIEVEDFNADGKLDFLMIGNSYATEVETGRYDAANGTLLFGKGNGNFDFLRNANSGFWASKEARDIEVIKLKNGKKLYLIANNNEALETYFRRIN